MNIIDLTYENFRTEKEPTAITTGDDFVNTMMQQYNNLKINKISLYIWHAPTQRTYKHTVYTKETDTHIHIYDCLYYLHKGSNSTAIPIVQTLHQHITLIAKKITHIHYNAKTFNDMILSTENAKLKLKNIFSFYNNNNYMSVYDILEEIEIPYILSLN